MTTLTPSISLVDGGSPYDCHVYLLDGGAEVALVDTGTGLAADVLAANVERVVPLDRLTHVFVTHYHADHAGGASALRARTGALVCASEETAAALPVADEEATQVAAARRTGVYPRDYRLPACDVDVVVTDEMTWQVGHLRVTAYASPGHCAGHVCYLVDDGTTTALCTGDAVFPGGRVSVQPIPDCSPYEYARTAARLASLPVDALLPGHLDPVLVDGAAHLTAAADRFARLVMPPNIAAAD